MQEISYVILQSEEFNYLFHVILSMIMLSYKNIRTLMSKLLSMKTKIYTPNNTSIITKSNSIYDSELFI